MRKFLTAAETAAALGLSKAALYMRVHRGTIPYVKMGGRKALRFDPRRLEEYMHEEHPDGERAAA